MHTEAEARERFLNWINTPATLKKVETTMCNFLCNYISVD